MSTFKEENPITYRIEQMRKNWKENICGDVQLVRWLIEKEEVRMVKAFSLLEGSEHGQIPELFLNFEIPFFSVDSYGKDLTDTWLTLWNNEEARKEVEYANVLPDWDDTPYRDCEEKNSDLTFLMCIASFARAIGPDEIMVLNVMPAAYDGDPGFVEWIVKCLKKLPANIRLMVYDLEDRQLFEKIPSFINAATLVADLKMNEAVKEIVTQGDSNNPAVGVNLCLLNISDAVNEEDEKQIHHWGKKGLKMAEDTGLKSIIATVYLAYGSAFFQLQNFKEALKLFHQAEIESISGMEANDDVAVPAVLLQTYNFQASTYLSTKKYDKAQNYFLETSKEALRQKNTVMYIEARRQAALMAEKRYEKTDAYSILKETYDTSKVEDKINLKFSSMLLLCSALHEYAFDHKNKELMNEIADFATEIWGEHWENLSQKEVYQTILNP